MVTQFSLGIADVWGVLMNLDEYPGPLANSALHGRNAVWSTWKLEQFLLTLPFNLGMRNIFKVTMQHLTQNHWNEVAWIISVFTNPVVSADKIPNYPDTCNVRQSKESTKYITTHMAWQALLIEMYCILKCTHRETVLSLFLLVPFVFQ